MLSMQNVNPFWYHSWRICRYRSFSGAFGSPVDMGVQDSEWDRAVKQAKAWEAEMKASKRQQLQEDLYQDINSARTLLTVAEAVVLDGGGRLPSGKTIMACMVACIAVCGPQHARLGAHLI